MARDQWHSSGRPERRRAALEGSDRAPLNCFLSLTEPVAKTVRRDDVEDLPCDAAPLFPVEPGELLVEAVGIKLGEQRREVLHVEGTTVLRGIAAIFCEADLDVVGQARPCRAVCHCATARRSRARFRRSGSITIPWDHPSTMNAIPDRALSGALRTCQMDQ
jgi:hypothetical protein